MNDILNHPAVQGGGAPFAAALIVALVLGRVRLGGLSVVAAFATPVFFVAGYSFTPLTATRKIILLGFAAPIVGMLADFAFKPTRIGGMGLLWADSVEVGSDGADGWEAAVRVSGHAIPVPILQSVAPVPPLHGALAGPPSCR